MYLAHPSWTSTTLRLKAENSSSQAASRNQSMRNTTTKRVLQRIRATRTSLVSSVYYQSVVTAFDHFLPAMEKLCPTYPNPAYPKQEIVGLGKL